MHVAATPGRGTIWRRISAFTAGRLPTGQGISDQEFAVFHRFMQCVVLAHIPLLVIVGLIVDSRESVARILVHVAPFAALAAMTLLTRLPRWGQAVLVALAMNGFSGLLIHLTDGLIESHFHFFVVLPLIALYFDWRPLVVSIGYVLVHHLAFGLLAPEELYNHQAALDSPLTWAIVHATYVAALTVVLVIQWNVLERQRRRLASAVDELHDTQSSLVQAQKLEAIGSLAAGIAHEINTPIQYVSDNVRFLNDGFIDLLQVIESQREALAAVEAGEGADDAIARATRVADEADLEFLLDEVPGAIAQSLSGVERVTEIVRAMKGFAHTGGEDFAPLDINGAISDTAIVARNEWKYAAELETDLSPGLPSVDAQAGPLKQVILNLIVNAAHAIEDHHGTDTIAGRIAITTERLDNDVHIAIKDNGGGIPAEIHDRIFEQFFTTKEVGRGSGQGLAISRSVIADLHGGRLWFDTVEGDGTTFHILLPIRRTEDELSHVA